MNEKHRLFSPFKAGKLSLKNRIVMAPCTRSRAIDNLPNESIARYYAQRASAGLIISECISPSADGLTYPRIPGIFNQDQINGWQQVTEHVHNYGGLIFAQLNHFGRLGSSLSMPVKGRLVGVSDIAVKGKVWTDVAGLVNSETPTVLDGAGVKRVINDFAVAAKNCITAGFDGIEIHGANGYLIEQFLNPHVNNRSDEYGGTIENRCRFTIEVVTAIVKEIGASRVGIRFSPYSELCELENYNGVPETYAYLSEQMNKLSLCYIHLVNPLSEPLDNTNKANAIADVHKIIRNRFSGLLILNGNFNASTAQLAIDQDQAELISFGRLFIANPDLPLRLEKDLELNAPNPDTFYTADEIGLTDYKFYERDVHQLNPSKM